jgi:hypothetical protein
VENVQNTKRWIVKQFAINANATNLPLFTKDKAQQAELQTRLKKSKGVKA